MEAITDADYAQAKRNYKDIIRNYKKFRGLL